MKHSENIQQQKSLKAFLETFNIQLTDEVLNQLYVYADFVVNTKEYGNLISVKDSEKFLTRHIADSLIPYIYIRENLDGKIWADMGAGAGCPVFPLAIVLPQVKFYAVEPRNKRVQFMEMVKQKMGLKNLTIVGKKFETSDLKELDVISCRALSTFENDWERAQNALKKDGKFVTLKSFANIEHLLNEPEIKIHKYNLPGEEQVYALVTRGNNG